MITLLFIKLTIADADDFGIVSSIDQVLGLSVRQFIQLDISRLFIDNQPVVIILDFGIPMDTKIQCEGKNKLLI